MNDTLLGAALRVRKGVGRRGNVKNGLSVRILTDEGHYFVRHSLRKQDDPIFRREILSFA